MIRRFASCDELSHKSFGLVEFWIFCYIFFLQNFANPFRAVIANTAAEAFQFTDWYNE
jgi:hypothetical protein